MDYWRQHGQKLTRNRPEEMNGIKVRQIPPQNIAYRLRHRETIGPGTSVSQYHATRRLHQNIFPNFTIINIEKPPCFLRKFTPDGRHLIAFSADQTAIEIYEYRGPAAAEDLLKHIPSSFEYYPMTRDGLSDDNEDVMGQDNLASHSNESSRQNNSHRHPHSHYESESEQITKNIFNTFFRLKHSVSVATNGEQLNRECSLFTRDSRFLIAGSAAFIPEENHPGYYEIYRNNESVNPSPRSPLEDYTLYVVDIENGKLCDKRVFKTDKIYLSHNQGIYLYDYTLAVLSVQHQTIHIFRLSSYDGRMIDINAIGRFCHEDDDMLVNAIAARETEHTRRPPSVPAMRPFREKTINALKHRILAYLFRKAKQESLDQGTPLPIRKFFQYFDQYSNLRIFKMQLLDEENLLIKYSSEDVVSMRIASDMNNNACSPLFVVYNFVQAEVIVVYENTSQEFLELFEKFCDLFRNTASNYQLISSPSNNMHARLLQQRFKHTIINARNGGLQEAVKRLLGQLPISSQSYSCSPYLDLALFSYDDKWVSVLERPKACGDHPIRFYARDSGLLRFKIYAGLQGNFVPLTARRLVAFIFHPFDPLAISVQRTNSEYVVNLHLRHSN